jgi:hypothetical protein
MATEAKEAAKAKVIKDAKKEGKTISEKTAEKLVSKTDGKSKKGGFETIEYPGTFSPSLLSNESEAKKMPMSIGRRKS